jgi:signal transduction histidine kinase
MATIMTATELLKNYSHKLSENQRGERLENIQAQIRNMTQLLEDVLVVNRGADNGQRDFNPVHLDIAAYCQRILDDYRAEDGGQHHFELEQHGSQTKMLADEKLLNHILTNLLSNAVKFSPPDKPIRLKLICTEREVALVIQDEGIGIPADDQKHLFGVFHRARNVGNIPGTGLGLAIVKQSAELHGGSVSLESQLGAGSTFTVTIPNVGSQ